MKFHHERFESTTGLPARIIIHSVDEFEMHWHSDMELILVLEGSIVVGTDHNKHLLKENDLILINSHQLHSTRRTSESNVLLAIQIDPSFYNSSFDDFSKLNFKCNSASCNKNSDQLNALRTYMAKIVWETNKKASGYKMRIAANLYLIGEYLINNFEHEVFDDEDTLNNSDTDRIRSITDFIKENHKSPITLKDVAEREHLNYFYLSGFIKDKLGVSFSELLNDYRLDSAVKKLLRTDKTILDISNESGFANINSFNNTFKNQYDVTPSEYRKNEGFDDYVEPKKSVSYLDIDHSKALEKLFTYLDNEVDTSKPVVEQPDFHKINIDVNGETEIYSKHWQKVTSFSRASEGLRVNLQRQLDTIQKDIGFNHVRFHGIFSDEMMVYNLDKDGNVIYNWTYVDELIDLLLEKDIKPFFDLTFMPSDLKRSDDVVFDYKGNIAPPKNINLWTDLVKAFIKHQIKRHSLSEVETWMFEVWNEPDLTNAFWAGSQLEYFEFYEATAKAFKSVSSNLLVGGPSITYGALEQSDWLEKFLEYSKENKVAVDFISVHIFQEYTSQETIDKAAQLILAGENPLIVAKNTKMSIHPEGKFEILVEDINKQINKYADKPIDLYVTEFNPVSEFGSPINDTMYAATFIVKTALSTINKVKAITYWTFTDLMEEHKLGLSHFHGGFGLINKDGIKKPAYNAFKLLSKLGNEIIDKTDNYIVTKDQESIQILAYNYTHFDDLFMSGDTSHLSYKERYSIYRPKGNLNLDIILNNLSGEYRITHYQLDRDHGSVFDVWNDMGAPEHMNKEEIEYLKSKEKPKVMVSNIKIEDIFNQHFDIAVHGVELVILEKL